MNLVSLSNPFHRSRTLPGFRGGQVSEDGINHLPGISPLGRLDGDPMSPEWCGHCWSAWTALEQLPPHLKDSDLGLYRIRGTARKGLVYIGQGKLRSRLQQHYRKSLLPLDQQGQIFSEAGLLQCAWVQNNDWYTHQRLELENDLIAAHVLHLEAVPSAQFLG